MMKKYIVLAITWAVMLCAYAQNDVTKFMGIPVDGTKSEMIQKLKEKGFRSSTNPFMEDALEGEFNGTQVTLVIETNNGKVWRIAVLDDIWTNDRDVKARFNMLCSQFENNENYLQFIDKQSLSDEEDIRYGIRINNKQYAAVFCQRPSQDKILDLYSKKVAPIILEKYKNTSLDNLAEILQQEDINKLMYEYCKEELTDLYNKKLVWFRISEYLGEFRIAMYYDNEFNKANGEDL